MSRLLPQDGQQKASASSTGTQDDSRLPLPPKDPQLEGRITKLTEYHDRLWMDQRRLMEAALLRLDFKARWGGWKINDPLPRPPPIKLQPLWLRRANEMDASTKGKKTMKASRQQLGATLKLGGDFIQRRRRALAANLPEEVNAKLHAWFDANVNHPYPTENEKYLLMHQTGLRMNQLNNWFIITRRQQMPSILNANQNQSPGNQPQLANQQPRRIIRRLYTDAKGYVYTGRAITDANVDQQRTVKVEYKMWETGRERVYGSASLEMAQPSRAHNHHLRQVSDLPDHGNTDYGRPMPGSYFPAVPFRKVHLIRLTDDGEFKPKKEYTPWQYRRFKMWKKYTLHHRDERCRGKFDKGIKKYKDIAEGRVPPTVWEKLKGLFQRKRK